METVETGGDHFVKEVETLFRSVSLAGSFPIQLSGAVTWVNMGEHGWTEKNKILSDENQVISYHQFGAVCSLIKVWKKLFKQFVSKYIWSPISYVWYLTILFAILCNLPLDLLLSPIWYSGLCLQLHNSFNQHIDSHQSS